MFGFKSPNPPITDWQGKRVWIIGASSGIGWSVAQSLHQKGAVLTLSARHLKPIQADTQLGQCRCLFIDVGNIVSVTRAIAQFNEPLDVVMIFAGTYQAGSLLAHTPQSIEQTMSTNLTGIIQLCHQLLPKLIKDQSGHLVLVGSSAAYLPMPNASVYGASKAGLAYFAQSLYTECLATGIAVSLVSPGFVKTRLTAQNKFIMPNLISSEQASEALLRGLAKGAFDIAFPTAFTLTLKLINFLPWRLRQSLLNRLAQQRST